MFKNDAKNAVLYARVSTEEQATRDYSIPAQVKAIYQFAQNNHISIVQEYIDEGKSARTADRPQFQLMINAAKRRDKSFSIILVHKTDRFSRNRADSVIYKSLLKRECDVDVISITENFEDSPTGKLLEGMMEVIAEFHSLNLAQEVMKGMQQKASKGEALGIAPFGYDIDKATKKLIINENEAPIVKMLFEMYASGKSYASIAEALNQAGILTARHKLWSATAVKRVIDNDVYAGQYLWNKVKKSTHTQKNPQEWILIEHAHQPVIPKALHDKVRKVQQSKATMKGLSLQSGYLLSSILKCGHCGHNMIGDKNNHVSGKIYIRYVCGNHRHHKQCFYNFVHKKEIEQLVLSNIKAISDSGKTEMNQDSKANSELSNIDRNILEAQLINIKSKFQRQIQAYEAGVFSLEQLQEAKAKTMNREIEIKQQLAQLDKNRLARCTDSDIIANANAIEAVIDKNALNATKLWLKENIYKIEVINKSDITICYRLPL